VQGLQIAPRRREQSAARRDTELASLHSAILQRCKTPLSSLQCDSRVAVNEAWSKRRPIFVTIDCSRPRAEPCLTPFRPVRSGWQRHRCREGTLTPALGWAVRPESSLTAALPVLFFSPTTPADFTPSRLPSPPHPPTILERAHVHLVTVRSTGRGSSWTSSSTSSSRFAFGHTLSLHDSPNHDRSFHAFDSSVAVIDRCIPTSPRSLFCTRSRSRTPPFTWTSHHDTQSRPSTGNKEPPVDHPSPGYLATCLCCDICQRAPRRLSH
jgi:hypothetical protein